MVTLLKDKHPRLEKYLKNLKLVIFNQHLFEQMGNESQSVFVQKHLLAWVLKDIKFENLGKWPFLLGYSENLKL